MVGARRGLNPWIATVNTVVLLTSSLTIVKAHQAMQRDDQQRARAMLGVTVLLGVAFLGFKAVEYSIEIAHGYTPVTHIFWSFYYALTGLHGLHVVAGVVTNAILFVHAGRGKLTLARAEAAGLYWHFVDIVWVFLFPLLYLSYSEAVKVARESHTNYTAIWAGLLALLFVSVGAVHLPFSAPVTTAFIFLVATVKVVVIAVYFMHLREETQLIRSLLWAPLVLFIIMTLPLVPDIVVERRHDGSAAEVHTPAQQVANNPSWKPS